MGVLDEISDFRSNLKAGPKVKEPVVDVRPKARPAPTPEEAAGFNQQAMPNMEQPRSTTEAAPGAPDFTPGGGNPRQAQPPQQPQQQPEPQAQPEQSPGGGTVNDVLDFIAEGGVPLAGVLTSTMARPVLNVLERPDQDAGTAALGAFADWSFAGGADVLLAGNQALNEWIRTGADYSTTYAEKKDEINMRLAENRIEFPAATLVGSIGGGVLASIIPAGIAGKAFQGSHWVTKGLILGGGTAGTEAGLYRYNSDGTRSEVLRDAGYGAIAGTLFGTAASGLGSALRRTVGKNTSNTERDVARKLLEAVNTRADVEGFPAMSPDQFNQVLKDRGIDAVMADYYPDMAEMLKTSMRMQGSEGRKMALDLLTSRNNVEKHFPQAIDDVVAAPRSRSLEEFSRFTKERQKRIKPKYDAMFDALPGGSFKVDGMHSALVKSFEDMPPNDRKQAADALKKFRELAGKRGENITPRELHNVKQELYSGTPNRDAKRVYDQVTQWIGEQASEYARLSRTYANTIDQEKAYKNGYKYFTAKKQTGKDVQRFIDSFDTYAEVTAFANGARRKMAEDLNGKAPAAVQKYFAENAHNVDKLRAVMGKERADKLLGAVLAETSAETVKRVLRKGKSVATKQGEEGVSKKELTDSAIALGVGLSHPSGIRAVISKLLPQDSNQPTTAANLVGQFAAAPLKDQPKLLQQLDTIARKGLPTGQVRGAARSGGAAGAAYGDLATNDTMTEDASATIESTRNPIQNFLQGLR